MNNILDCVNAFNNLLTTEYIIKLGRKGKLVELNLSFNKKDCYHLMGLQYLTDIPQLIGDREKIYNQICSGKIKPETVEASEHYARIRERINCFPSLEQIIDSNDTIFKYNDKLNVFSMITADYLMQNYVMDQRVFLFLAKDESEDYFCKSFFPDNKTDYSKGQASWTLLYKEKVNKQDNTSEILFSKLKTIDVK